MSLLKAFFDESYVIPNPVMPNPADGGQTTVPLSPLVNLTVGGELNKVANNVAFGRNIGKTMFCSFFLKKKKQPVFIGVVMPKRACCWESK